MVEVCLATFKFNGLCETMDCFFIGTFPVKRDPLIVVSKRILRVNSDCLGIIVDSSIKLTYLVKSKSPVEKRLKMLREYLKRSWVEVDSCLVVTLLPCSIALRVVSFCLLFDLLVLRSIHLVALLRWSLRNTYCSRSNWWPWHRPFRINRLVHLGREAALFSRHLESRYFPISWINWRIKAVILSQHVCLREFLLSVWVHFFHVWSLGCTRT